MGRKISVDLPLRLMSGSLGVIVPHRVVVASKAREGTIVRVQLDRMESEAYVP